MIHQVTARISLFGVKEINTRISWNVLFFFLFSSSLYMGLEMLILCEE